LCEWAFSDPESKEQFKAWLDEACSPKGETEEEACALFKNLMIYFKEPAG
jgi:hypothetical protein